MMTDYDKKDRSFSVRLPSVVATALDTAATSDLLSLSDVVRMAILKDLRQRGLLKSAAACSAATGRRRKRPQCTKRRPRKCSESS
jgi:hypothetical protein